MVTKEQIEQRIAMLTASRDQHVANANATNGAIAEANHWLGVLAAELAESPKITEAPTES